MDAVHADEQMNDSRSPSPVTASIFTGFKPTRRGGLGKRVNAWHQRPVTSLLCPGDIDLGLLFNTNGFMLEGVSTNCFSALSRTSKTMFVGVVELDCSRYQRVPGDGKPAAGISG